MRFLGNAAVTFTCSIAFCKHDAHQIHIYMEFMLSPKTFHAHSMALFRLTRFPRHHHTACKVLVFTCTGNASLTLQTLLTQSSDVCVLLWYAVFANDFRFLNIFASSICRLLNLRNIFTFCQCHPFVFGGVLCVLSLWYRAID